MKNDIEKIVQVALTEMDNWEVSARILTSAARAITKAEGSSGILRVTKDNVSEGELNVTLRTKTYQTNYLETHGDDIIIFVIRFSHRDEDDYDYSFTNEDGKTTEELAEISDAYIEQSELN